MTLNAIESIKSRLPAALEVLVIDDGSTDGTAGVLAGFGAPVRVVFEAGDGGARLPQAVLDGR